MISKEELTRIAQQTGLHLYQQEKDYLLKLFLYFYYKQYQDAIFKGGTCLKYLLGLERFSEDLDFNIKNPSVFKQQVRTILHRLEDMGIHSYFLKEELFSGSYTCEIGFEGPLYTRTAQTQNKFIIDAGYRLGTLQKPEWKIIKSEYPQTAENFLVLVMDFQEILVEKIMALMQRKKGRDLYDVWFLIQADVKLNQKLLQHKAKQEKVNIDIHNLLERKEYENDMSRLTKRVIPYQQIIKAVEKMLQEN